MGIFKKVAFTIYKTDLTNFWKFKVFETFDIIIYRTIITDVGMFFFYEFLSHANHLGDKLRNRFISIETGDSELF